MESVEAAGDDGVRLAYLTIFRAHVGHAAAALRDGAGFFERASAHGALTAALREQLRQALVCSARQLGQSTVAAYYESKVA